MRMLSIPLALAGCVLAAPALASAPHPAAIAQMQAGPSAGTHRLALVAGHLRPGSVYTVSAAVAGARPAGCAASLRVQTRSDARGDLRVFTPYRADWCAGASYAGAIARPDAAPDVRFSLSVPGSAAAQRVLVTGSVRGGCGAARGHCAPRALPRVSITVETAKGASVTRATTRADGTFSLSLPAGAYRAVFPHVRGYAHTPAPRRFTAAVGFVVTLRPSVYMP